MPEACVSFGADDRRVVAAGVVSDGLGAVLVVLVAALDRVGAFRDRVFARCGCELASSGVTAMSLEGVTFRGDVFDCGEDGRDDLALGSLLTLNPP